MNTGVLDASAVLVYLFDERGVDVVRKSMDDGAAISTANVQEVVARLVRMGATLEDASTTIDDLAVEVFDLTSEDAVVAGGLIKWSAPHGLSAGDRCCLALAHRLRLPAISADRAWAEMPNELGVTIVLVR